VRDDARAEEIEVDEDFDMEGTSAIRSDVLDLSDLVASTYRKPDNAQLRMSELPESRDETLNGLGFQVDRLFTATDDQAALMYSEYITTREGDDRTVSLFRRFPDRAEADPRIRHH
jgi:hypothetical protein